MEFGVSGPPAGRERGGLAVPGPGVRKTVTILFTDLVDSSRLSRTFDPEALWKLRTRYFEARRNVPSRPPSSSRDVQSV